MYNYFQYLFYCSFIALSQQLNSFQKWICFKEFNVKAEPHICAQGHISSCLTETLVPLATETRHSSSLADWLTISLPHLLQCQIILCLSLFQKTVDEMKREAHMDCACQESLYTRRDTISSRQQVHGLCQYSSNQSNKFDGGQQKCVYGIHCSWQQGLPIHQLFNLSYLQILVSLHMAKKYYYLIPIKICPASPENLSVGFRIKAPLENT